jgi:8-oxo-dGTP pyrophosphatase MutT (NUDIX family)
VPTRFQPSLFRDVLARRAAGSIGVDPSHPKAAVAAIFRERADDAEVLLIRRSKNPNDPWSGHMAFPGGRMDPSDPDLLETVRRETLEEIGLDLREHADLLGRLDELPAMARGKRAALTIAPFVFVLRALPPLVLNHEVDAVVWASLGPLRSGEAATTLPYGHEGRTIELPGLRVGEDVVWGLTHRMLLSLFAILDSEHEPEASS